MPETAAAGAAGVAVVVVIFTVRREGLSVLLINRAAEPFAGHWALPGGLLLPNERLEDAAARRLVRETGVADVYLEQLFTFDAPNAAGAENMPSASDAIVRTGGPRATVAYFALVDEGQVALEERTAWRPAWFVIADLPQLAFANNAIVDYALQRLQAKLGYSNVAWALLPERFTLTQLQRVYEAILGRRLDKRNFRKRVLSLGFMEETSQFARSGAHRPARLYRFCSREPATF